MRILVAEDDDATARILRRVLEKRGHTVVHAEDGLIAFEHLRTSGPFDAVITDWMMPRLDGIGFVRKARLEIEKLPPIIVVTAVASLDAREQVLDAGADDYLAKPVQPQELVRCLDACLARHRQIAADTALPGEEPVDEASSVVGIPLVALVAGAGGPVAIQRIFRKIQRGSDCAFVVIQHGPHWMVEAFAQKLQGQCSLAVSVAQAGEVLKRGSIFIAPGDTHLVVSREGDRLLLTDAPPQNFVRPSGDLAFQSIARRSRCSAVVILSGLGCDGARGALSFSRAGGRVIIQHPATAEVASMPSAALALLPAIAPTQLPEIPTQLDAWLATAEAALGDVPPVNDTSRVPRHA
jgi:two-component system, chemotaxis family, protein-glutamate methylesterase/glutaminase